MGSLTLRCSQVGLILESGEVNVVHQMCVLIGFGLDAVCPYMVYETVAKLRAQGLMDGQWDSDTVAANFKKSVDYGMRKVCELVHKLVHRHMCLY